MATPTYDPIASTTLTSSASSVTFSSLDTIAAGYRDLVLVVDSVSGSFQSAYLRFNSDSGSNYNSVRMQGNGSTAASLALSSQSELRFGWVPQNALVQIMDFAATDKHKTVLSRGGDSATIVHAHAGRWSSTSAITSIYLFCDSTYPAGSVFSLYGIAA